MGTPLVDLLDSSVDWHLQQSDLNILAL